MRSMQSYAVGIVVVCLMVTISHAQPRELVSFVNILENAHFEAGAAATDSLGVSLPPGWISSGNATLVRYAAVGGFPTEASPGPVDRGAQFVAGGPAAATSTILQQFEVRSGFLQGLIDVGGLFFEARAWLGGSSSDEDHATVALRFLDGKGTAVDVITLGPVTREDRGAETALLFRAVTGEVPARTRAVDVVITMTRRHGAYNHGFADELEVRFIEAEQPVQQRSWSATKRVFR